MPIKNVMLPKLKTAPKIVACMWAVVCMFIFSTCLISAETIDYTYDDLNRLKRVDYGNGTAVVYDYDEVGNRLVKVTSPDTDGDLITDYDETNLYGTDPNAADTDDDGINDGDELAYWGDNWNGDYDTDGVSNLVDPDSDNDNIIDGVEINRGSDPSDPGSIPYVAYDFDGNGKADILWHNDTTGQVYIWFIDGDVRTSRWSPGTVSDLAWQIIGAGDFNGDRKADILWRNTTNGEVVIWLLDGASSKLITSETTGTVSNFNWVIQGIGDFNKDGKSDILWYDTTTGDRNIWHINGTSKICEGSLGNVGLNWKIKGVGDFNRDGRADILTHNSSDGVINIEFIDADGYSTTSGGSPGTLSYLNWDINGVGDFNNDGMSDVICRYISSGRVYIALMDGYTQLSFASPGVLAYDTYKIRGASDFGGDRKSDILWRKITTGHVYIWQIDGTTRLSLGSPGLLGLNWQIK